MAEKWLELSLKKFPSYIFRNNVESETVLYLTNGRKRGWDKSPILSIVFGLSSKTQWLSGLYYADFISFYSPTQLCGGGTTKSNSNEWPISVSHSPLKFLFPARVFTETFPQSLLVSFLSNLSLFIFFRQLKTFQSFTRDKKIKSKQMPHLDKSLGSIRIKVNSEKENTVKARLNKAHRGR